MEAYLRRKGALEVLIEIGLGSATFQNVDEAVLVSSSTVSNRLQEGVENELIEVTHRPIDHGTQKRYTLTTVGTRVVNRVREIDLDKTVQKLQRLHRERETELERLIGRLNRDKLIIGYEHEQNPPSIPEDNIPPDDAIGGLEPPSESDQKAAHRKRLEDDLVGLDEETDDGSDDQM
ncbi:hypothetical protein LPA44_13830 [Halobacterium sp. KA-4]|uniref:hypothetical protein n=1 Tax=Halobacterium sp. KA-4 TaxID=2896367 RepID=UPI001E5FA2F0|nr:hypothetical protein [Halobacterium sp. KA-4]MCD2200965.1 hypothetical protein [Halobacterium sp. KA-4]